MTLLRVPHGRGQGAHLENRMPGADNNPYLMMAAIYAAGLDGEAPDAIDFRGSVALVLGNEGKGIRRNVLEHCDRVVTIPMTGHVDSFNVAAAAAVLCYEVRRQHRTTGASGRNT